MVLTLTESFRIVLSMVYSDRFFSPVEHVVTSGCFCFGILNVVHVHVHEKDKEIKETFKYMYVEKLL